MQSFELLGGKYQQGEQILPGVVQSFRSYEVPTGRPVFIHRVASDNPAAQEIADLLSAGLIRSPAVRKMLVDVYETEPYRFIVTEPARQCVPLREWLEREAQEEVPDVVTPVAAPIAKAPAPVAPAVKNAPEPEPPVEEEDPAPSVVAPAAEAESAEFARLFQAALSGKLERSRRKEAQQQARVVALPEPEKTEPIASAAVKKVAPVVAPNPAPTPAPAAPEPATDLFTQVADVDRAGKSTLIIFLVVLAVLALLLVMFVLVFVKR